MKTIKLTLVIAITFLSIQTLFAQKKVKGNGTITQKNHTTKNYDAIEVVGFMDVSLEYGKEGIITVVTDENIHQYLTIESKGGTLVIKVKNNVNINTKKGVHITVPFTDISELSLTGSGDISTVNQPIKTDTFEVELTGSGDIVIDVEARTIDAKITGSGDLKLSGTVTDLEVKVTGSGDFTGKSLESKNTQVYVSGSGDAVVHASESIKARVNGSGDIVYYGNPKKSSTKVLGSGDIESH